MNLEFAAVDDAVFVPEPSVGAIVVLAGLFMRPGFRLAAQNSPSIRRSALEGVDFLSQGIRMADSGTGLRCVPSQRAREGR